IHHLCRMLDDLAAGLVIVENYFACRAEHENNATAALDEVLQDPRVGRIVDREIRVEWRHDRRNYTFEFRHCLFLSDDQFSSARGSNASRNVSPMRLIAITA